MKAASFLFNPHVKYPKSSAAVLRRGPSQQKMELESIMWQIWMCSHPLALSHSLESLAFYDSVVYQSLLRSDMSPSDPYRSVLGSIDPPVETNMQANRGNVGLWHIKSSFSSLKPDALPFKRGYRLKKVLSYW